MYSLIKNCSDPGSELFSKTENYVLMNFEFKYLAVILTLLIVLRFSQLVPSKFWSWKKPKSWIDLLPGPRQFPIIGGLHYFRDLTKTFKVLHEWSALYGNIFRSEGIFNEPIVFLNDASDVQAVLSSNHVGLVTKPVKPYDALFGQFLKNGLLISKGEYWRSHRRILSRGFTYQSYQGYAKLFSKYTKRLVEELEKLFSADDEPHQISCLIHCCSLQIICASVMGLELCGNDDGRIFYESLHRYKILSSKRAMNPILLFDFFWRMHPLSREYNQLINTMNNITRKIIAKHKEAKETDAQIRNNNADTNYREDDIMGKKPCRSMMDEMLASDLTPEEILIEINTVIAAGFESTSLTVHYMLFLLALNPEHQRVCQEEIDEIFNDPVKCRNGNLTMDGVADMKYLERCCNETLRIFPIIFMFQRKPEVAVKLDDERELPPNTTVAISPILMHNNPEYYPDPKKFQPDRFLPENNRKRHPYSYLPFSAGIRNCIGMKFAIMESKAIAAYILRHFEVSTVDKIDDVTLLPSIVMTPQRDYMFHMKRRQV
ncbi:Cytochrome P450 4C1 [Orchesella cincta]|uniref:Cytochrome P450 4C1 n=1 Tax=Orchesella cincta TaxID=48709 RepID=A0A1D2NGV5_ORCCI|nr:Cytochrome P450 4C1 [Orchesella cincta]